jgi:hypothetical protein
LLLLTPDSFTPDFGLWFGNAWRPAKGFFGMADSVPAVAFLELSPNIS